MQINNPTTFSTPDLTLTTSNSSGSAGALRADDSILVYDTTVPSSLTPTSSASVGTAQTSARRDHVHAASGIGGVSGPGSSVDNGIVRWNGTGGATLQGYTSNTPIIGDSGIMSLPGQSAFSARVTSDLTNVTGDGTMYTVIFGTEHYDQNNDFNNSTSTFTAPVAGKYLFTACVSILSGSTTSGTEHLMQLVADGTDYNIYNFARAPAEGLEPWQMKGVIVVNMAASSTAIIRIRISGEGSDSADVEGGGSSASIFTGTLIA